MKEKAIVLVIVTLLLTTIAFYAVPTVAQEPIKIGVMGPMGLIQGDGMKEGAQLAVAQIGTILGRSIELVYADEFQGAADGTAETGRLAMEFLMAAGCDFVIGGFRSESVFGAREVACDYEKIYLTTGAATDDIIDHPDTVTYPDTVRGNYERYKYLFRITPMNATMLVNGVLGRYYAGAAGFLTYAIDRLKLIYGTPVKYAAVVENLVWAQGFAAILSNYTHPLLGPMATAFLGPDVKLVYFAAVSPTATDLDTELTGIKASGARLIIQILSAEMAGRAFVNSWDALDVNAIPVGINVIDQMSEAWDETGGAVEYESTLATTGTRTPLTEVSTDIWDAYVAMWDRKPIYTAWGAYTGVGMLAAAIEAAGSLDNDAIIPQLEQTDTVTGAGKFKFTGPNPATDFDPATPGDQPYPYSVANPTMKGTRHDLYMTEYGPTWTEGYVRTMMVQWQNERHEVVYPQDQLYSRRWKLPPRMGEVYVDDTLVYSVETDLNLDGEVDIYDVVTAATAFGAKPGDPTWSIEANIVVDGVIDIFDIVKIATAFGQAAPEWPLP